MPPKFQGHVATSEDSVRGLDRAETPGLRERLFFQWCLERGLDFSDGWLDVFEDQDGKLHVVQCKCTPNSRSRK